MENNKNIQTQNGYDENGLLFGEFKAPTYEEWKEAATVLLKGKPFDKAMYTKTPEGITLQPIYTKEHLEELPHSDSLPGFPPYVRGTKADGNLNEPWLVSQEVYAGTPKAFNEAILNDLFRGLTVLNMGLDMPTQFGIDPDHESAENVGFKGVSISSLEDLNNAFQDLVLEVLPIHINSGMNPVPMTAMIGAHLESKELTFSSMKGILGYDPIGMLSKHGDLSVSLSEAYDLMADVTKWVAGENSEVRTILVEGHPYHDGGADAIQELAYAMAIGVEYIKEMLDRGMDIESITSKMAFSFSLGSNFFMELSKIRAARLMFSKIVEAFGGSAEAQKIFTHAKTSSWTKTVYDPYVNMLRNASEAFSGAVAGVDSLSVLPFDEPIREADEFSRRVSRNVQAILQDECNFTQPIDPAGGSWYIESLTNEIAQKSWDIFQDIESKGGFSKMLLKGEVQSAVEMKYEGKFKNMAKRKHVWVGVNMYANMTEEKLKAQSRGNDDVLANRRKTVEDHRLKKDVFMIAASLSELGDYKATSGKISMELAVKAAEMGATIGDLAEICSAFTEEGQSVKPVKRERGSERFEALRDKTMELKSKNKGPKVFLFNIGPIPQHKGRADFSTGFFEVGGFEVLSNNGFMDSESAVKAGLDSGAHIGVICSTDAVYPEFVPEIAKAVKEQNPDMTVVVAGRPSKELEVEYRDAGVDHFIYMGADCYTLLASIQEEVAQNA